MNYSRIIDKETGDILGYLATEPGTINEITLVEKAFDLGLKLEPTTEEEYNGCNEEDWTEIKPDWMK
jgi:hypothetical protein